MQMSHSRVECFNQCPRKFRFRYVEGLQTIPDDAPDNALYLGTALHTGIETGSVETAIDQYFGNYPVITDECINEAMKLEAMIPKAQEAVPNGLYEVLISDPDFHGYIDLLVPIENRGGIQVYDLYDFKYSNHKETYMNSDQLHLYKHYLEKANPLSEIRNMFFLMVPKSTCKPIKGEDIVSYRKRLEMDLSKLTPELVPIAYDPMKVIRFLTETKHLLEEQDYPKHEGFLCRFCEFEKYCKEGEDYMILPENKRRNISAATKKVVWIYGAPFSGKTTFANKFPDPLMLNTDGNIKFVDAPFVAIKDDVHKEGRMTVRKSAWEVFKETVDTLELKENTFKTIVVDLLEDTYEACRRYVCEKRGWEHESDDSFKAWDMVRTEFLTTMKKLVNLDYDIVLISHLDTSKDITKKGGDKITSIKPNINDKTANKIAGMVDIVARMIAENDEYSLSFKKSEVVFGGGRLKFRKEEIPATYEALCDLYDDMCGASEAKIKPVVEQMVEVMPAPENEPEKTQETAQESAQCDEPAVLAEDTYYHTIDDDNYVMRHAGDPVMTGSVCVITKEEFNEGVKRIAHGTEDAPVVRRRRKRTE